MGLRMGAGGYFFRTYFSGLMSKDGIWATQESIDEAYTLMIKSLDLIEKIWLPKSKKTRFMFGDKPSIADLSLACEITNLMASGYDLGKHYPGIHTWIMDAMMTIPSFKSLHDESLPRTRAFYKLMREKQQEDGI